ncbi:hypothetical protein Cob_v007900 [Colletotrichum orbiculare MAFF 240422]|uniref:Uncharacterized protein n=1 Tax=Colletotrichum orbiculare (strain 104-T / ATCC 96160 / CBS 514.97 / LARS 414 / MAFF 240422) TaxID=1213857 RepID=A0A484FMA8_COLOR|nr:hypothetical protein Cob_v007900 [Colletotrichum orbiculare MAFF 240422]
MGFKSPEVHETQILTNQDDFSDESKGREKLIPLLQSKDKQCSPDKAHQHGWKPLTVSAVVLFSFALASFILAAMIEILAQQSSRNGGLALSPSPNDIPAYARFGYLFLPTIIAVVYSLLWSWIDLDVKRIQPWVEMSKPEGATATRSIFLDYPYDFVAFAPVRAARRRHWAVFYSGTVMVMIFWLITPLQSAILGSGPVIVRGNVAVTAKQVLRPASEQILTMDQSILNEGYAITWLKQPYPPYTTPEYTLLPFEVERDTKRAPSTNWTGTTTKFWTELNCWPSEIYPGYPIYDFLDGRGCNASDIVPYGAQATPEQPYKMQYIGYHNSPWADYWLSLTCSKAATHQFLAIWARYKEKEEVSSVFCETNYFKQQVNATVSAHTKTPIAESIVPVGPRETLSTAEFNSSAFEHLLGAGVSSVELEVQREYPFGHLLEQHHQVKHLGLRWPASPLVGFAIGSRNVTTLDPFQNDTFMGEAFNATHKMLFSLAVRRMLTNASIVSSDVGNVEFVQHGIIVSRLFSAIVEGSLLLVGVFSLLLWFHSKRAPSRLAADPASVGSLMSVCQNSSVLLDKFAGKGCLSEEKLREEFEDKRFRLLCGCQSRSGQTVIKVIDTRQEFIESQRISLPEPDAELSMGHYSPVKPLALRREIGLLVIVSMVGALAALVYLKLEELRIGGLVRPTTNFEVLQILENYIPTMFATLLEPFWVLVNRLLCTLQPFKELWSGQRRAKGSINARYTSMPPQFVFWRAAKSGHFMLVAICLLAMLSNLLAVGLGGLFNELPVSVYQACEMQQLMKPVLNNDSITGSQARRSFSGVIAYEMQFYIAMNNVSQGTPLPAWVNKEYFFQPFEPVTELGYRADAYTAQTRGFGINPSCSAAATIKSKGRAPALNYTYTRDGQTFPGCPTTFSQPDLDLNTTWSSMSSGPSTAETVRSLGADYGTSPCEVPVILSWSRSSQTQDKLNGEMETWFVVCEPVFTTSMFNVTVNSEGQILDAVQTSDSSPTLDYPLSTNNTDAITTHLNRLIDGGPFPWHNDTLSRDWINYLLKIQPGHAAILDPLTVPNTTELAPAVGAIYRQLWAIFVSLNPQFFETHTAPVVLDGGGTERHTETRIFMDPTALVISLAVLGLNIAVAVVLYAGSIKHFLPRMPTTIGSILAYVAPSRAVREYDGPGSLASATFSFGRFVGDDGRAHVGVELYPYVIPVKLSSLRKGETGPRKGILRRVLGHGRKDEGDTWL